MIKIDIISGFLGSGKTTLIQKLFQTGFNKEKVVIIENEFGDISIDSGFLKDSGVEIKEINAGCICCSLVGDFSTSIKELVTKFSPDRIIIEPSGVGKLSDIISAVKKVDLAELQLNILATVVDGKKAKMYLKNFGEFFLNQIEAASTIIISKTENLTEVQVEEVLHIIREHNSHADIITTPIKDLNSETLLKTLEEHQDFDDLLEDDDYSEHEHCCCHHHDEEEEEHHCCHHHDEEEHHCCHDHEEDDEHHCCHHHEDEEEHHHHDEEEHHCCHDHEEDNEHHCCHHHEDEEEHHCHHHEGHHHADEIFTSWGKQTAKSISFDQLKSFLEALNNEDLGLIVRSKGILKAKDNEKWYYFDYVSGEIEIRLGEPDFTGRIVVIGSKINEEKINTLFENI